MNPREFITRLWTWHRALALVLALPALVQLAWLGYALWGRYDYPFDLEWMEGGVLHHAQRIADGNGIYVEPSVEFIPFLYTPLYPGLLAVLGKIGEIGYTLGRLLSIASLIGIGVVCVRAIRGPSMRSDASPAETRLAVVGGVLALGLFAGAYPYVEGWYDLVRADTLMLFMVTLGLHLVMRTARDTSAPWGLIGFGLAAGLLATAFFAKQTAIFYVALGGVITVLLRLRRAPLYIAITGLLGLGGVAIMQRSSGGWFWTYVFDIHQAHDFNMDRFWRAFGQITGFISIDFGPVAMTMRVASIVMAGALLTVLATAIFRRQVPAAARTFLLWLLTFAVSTVLGAIGYGTEFAHANAFIPAFLHGAIATGLALPTLAACLSVWRRGDDLNDARGWPAWVATIGALALGIVMLTHRWSPSRFVPTDDDRLAGDALIARLANVEGLVWTPSHPWYAHLAGKTPYVHRMGIRDVTWRKPRPVRGLNDAIRLQAFGAILTDAPRDVHQELGGIPTGYRPAFGLESRTPRSFSGAKVRPEVIWVPAKRDVLPYGAHVLFDFEANGFAGFTTTGNAWGTAPVPRERKGAAQARGFGGRYFADSGANKDAGTGTLASPSFVISFARMTFLMAGGGDNQRLRVELRVDGVPVRTALAPAPSSATFKTIDWDLSDLEGRTGQLVAVDEATNAWGYLAVDEVWAWR